MIHEPLVLNQPGRPSRAQLNGSPTIWNGIRGVRDVTIECVRSSPWWRVERQLPIRLKVELPRNGIAFWRPLVVTHPLVRAGPERQRLWQIEGALFLQVKSQEARQHVLPIILRGLTAEIDRTKFLPVASGPAAVAPRADDEKVH